MLTKKMSFQKLFLFIEYLYIYFACLSVRMSVRCNVKTAKLIGPKCCVGPYKLHDPKKGLMDAQNDKNLCTKVFDSC